MFDPVVLTRENVLEALTAVVEQKGRDYIYVPPGGKTGDCVYFCKGNDGLEPSCLWGHVLIRLGMCYHELEMYAGKTVNQVFDYLGVDDADLRIAALRSQVLQDCGSSWGVAYDAFVRCLSS